MPFSLSAACAQRRAGSSRPPPGFAPSRRHGLHRTDEERSGAAPTVLILPKGYGPLRLRGAEHTSARADGESSAERERMKEPLYPPWCDTMRSRTITANKAAARCLQG